MHTAAPAPAAAAAAAPALAAAAAAAPAPAPAAAAAAAPAPAPAQYPSVTIVDVDLYINMSNTSNHVTTVRVTYDNRVEPNFDWSYVQGTLTVIGNREAVNAEMNPRLLGIITLH